MSTVEFDCQPAASGAVTGEFFTAKTKLGEKLSWLPFRFQPASVHWDIAKLVLLLEKGWGVTSKRCYKKRHTTVTCEMLLAPNMNLC